MASRNKPRSGSVAYSPRKRVKKQTPRIHSWADSGEAKLLGFSGYKAGMTHVMATDNNKNRPTYGLEIAIPVTVINTPPMFVSGIRFYMNGYPAECTYTDVWCENPPTELERRITKPKKPSDVKSRLDEIKKNLDKVSEVRLITITQPKLTPLPKKTPDIMETAIGGALKEKFDYAVNALGKEVNVDEIFHDNQIIDVTSVTKGKGLQGVIKRWGTTLQPRKSTGRRRHIGTGGAWTPSRKLWREPLAGQTGYHTRTEYNKVLLKIGGKGAEEVTPSGGFLRYGIVQGKYVLIKGSVPGPTKRLIRLTLPRRKKKDYVYAINQISRDSKQGA